MKSDEPLAGTLALSAYEAVLAIDQSVLEAIPAAVYLCAADGVIVRFNRRATELWGRSPRAGDTDERFCGALRLYDSAGKPLAHGSTPMAAALRSGERQQDHEVVIERPDGSRIVALVNIDPLKDAAGRVQGAMNCFLDITARKRDEAELRTARTSLEDFFENAVVPMHWVGTDGTVLRANRAELDLLGYTREEYIGRHIADFHADHPAIDQILARLSSGDTLDKVPATLRTKDGGVRQVLISSSGSFRDGRLVNTRCVTVDVTAEKRAEEALARRMGEQATLYRLTDKLHRAKSLSDVYDAALEAIQGGLRCPRASVLLFDASGVMRFVAWRHLSEGYRQAVDGHSPWTSDSRDPHPICIDDIASAELDEPLRRTIQAEGIAALAFVPLVTDGRLVGKFMVYYDAPHAFSGGEMELAVAIARQLGFGVERLRAEEARRSAEKELRKSEARERANAAEMQAIMESVPAIIWMARDPDCRVITGNPASYAFLGLPPGANQSQSAPEPERPAHFEVLAEGRMLAPEELPVQRAARGEEVRGVEVEHRFRDGTSRHLFGNAAPLRDARGRPRGAVAAFVDITDRKRVEEQRDLLLAELSHRVKNTLATVIAIARRSLVAKSDVDEARRSFEARILALAETHSRLAETHWCGVSFEAMLRDGLTPFRQADAGSLRLAGPPVSLAPKCAVSLGMTIHELATNAAKYGALSAEGGAVDVAWQVDDGCGRLRIRWAERGGPPVAPPDRKGFGRLLIEQSLRFDLGADVELDFAEGGLRCAIAIPLQGHVTRVG